ncbi:hypothetical protein, partial [Streptomyces clavuligerus]|uniref:hypothetical protein n=2 Tax=Streptomyces clavuligerus TaxID=1901 RepID=UPI001E4F2C0B
MSESRRVAFSPGAAQNTPGTSAAAVHSGVRFSPFPGRSTVLHPAKSRSAARGDALGPPRSPPSPPPGPRTA